MDLNLDFLKDVKLKPIEVLAPQRRSRVSRIPGDDADLRVFANGKVYPSKRFVTENSLEYVKREELPDGSYDVKGNGLDVFSSTEWNMFPEDAEAHFIFVAVVPKAYPKVSLFGNTKYNDDNTPKNSVLEQGNSAFGQHELVQMLTDIYKVDWNVKEYVDLVVADSPISNEQGIYHIPKLVTSGKNKGKYSFIRRDNIVINPLILLEDVMNTPVEVEGATQEVSGDSASGADELPFEQENNDVQAETTDWSKLGS